MENVKVQNMEALTQISSYDAAAGGRFRGRLGRAFFKTERLCQSVLEPDLVTNKVEWKLFGVLPGHVGLRGTFKGVGEGEDTVEANPFLTSSSLHPPITCSCSR
jgi:hypothetical protein